MGGREWICLLRLLGPTLITVGGTLIFNMFTQATRLFMHAIGRCSLHAIYCIIVSCGFIFYHPVGRCDAGVLFTTLPPDEVGMATRSAVTLMLRDVMLMAKERVVTEVYYMFFHFIQIVIYRLQCRRKDVFVFNIQDCVDRVTPSKRCLPCPIL
jgi:hypothetical protein